MDICDITNKREISEALRKQVLSLRSNKTIRMLPERELAEKLGVSRMSLRNALKALREEGLLEQRQGSGTFITPKEAVDHIHLVIASDLKHDDPFCMAFLSELSKTLARHAISIQFVEADSLDFRAETSIPLLILGILDQAALDTARKYYKYILTIHSYPDSDCITQITFDDYQIGFVAAKRLLAAGYKRIIHLAGPDFYLSPRLRCLGFLDGAERREQVLVIHGKMNWTWGYDIGPEILAHYRAGSGPLGVFAANDWMALGLLRRLGECGLRVPGDVAIIGCDDIPLASQTVPALSTFKWDFPLVADEILVQIREMQTSQTYINKKILYTAPFITRASLKH